MRWHSAQYFSLLLAKISVFCHPMPNYAALGVLSIYNTWHKFQPTQARGRFSLNRIVVLVARFFFALNFGACVTSGWDFRSG